ncbi:M16 family metallopeptidase [Leptospira sp. GIMC2001]|uniref:M16 family metallopeptidase n=1 Tax=Leptospira sp. GIMC2001 TaxID=1513297 RepID=UPI00234A75AF|nr:pitrilysin family protein [Leptospira sp. GIMC2001]WCL50830.1 pitrilysin family protein [Leptospira sp. GIMC2001]
MRQIYKFLLSALVICIPLSGIVSDDLFKQVSIDLEKKIKTVEFENGLRLIMVQRNESPTIAIYTKFLVGAVDETPEISGTAHLLEHMLFKGTPNVGTRDYAREKKYQDQIEVWGSRLDKLRLEEKSYKEKGILVPKDLSDKITAQSRRLRNLEKLQNEFIIKSEDSYIYEQNGEVGFNAYTSQDVTNYQIQLPSNRLEIWAKMESDRLKNPILREYYTERDVVIEERRMRTENSGAGLLRERFMSVAMEAHPYRRPVIGYPSVIPFLDIFETKEFFRKNYHSGNMVITIVGQLDFENTESIVRKYFSDLARGEKRKEIKISEIQSSGAKKVEVFYPAGESILMGWRKPTIPHPDNSAFDMLDAILAKGSTSRLYKRLVLDANLCSEVNASNGYPGERYTNIFLISMRNNQGADTSEIESIVWEEIEKIAKDGVNPEEIQKVKNDAISDFFRYLDSNGSLADSLGYYALVTGDWRNLFRIYDQMNSVTSLDLQRVASIYLKRDNVTIGYLKDPRLQAKNLKENDKGKK